MLGTTTRRNIYRARIVGRMSINRYQSNLLIVRSFSTGEKKHNWREIERPIITNEEKPRRKHNYRRRRFRDGKSHTSKKNPKTGQEYDPLQSDKTSNEKINSIFLHLNSLLTSYQEKLFKGIENKVVKERDMEESDDNDILTVHETISQLQALNAKCQDEKLNVHWSSIEDTEIIFRDTCNTMQKAIAKATPLQDSKGYLAEKLLRLFLDFRNERASLVRHSKEKEQTESLLSSFTTWFSTLTEGVEEKDFEKLAVSAHDDMSFAPKSHLLSGIIAQVFLDVPHDETNLSILSKRADRLLSLLELNSAVISSRRNAEKNPDYVLRALAAVGTLERANEAQQIWRKIAAKSLSLKHFNKVLSAYELASQKEKNFEERSKAVFEVERLLLQQWRKIKKTDDGNSIGHSFEIALKVLLAAPVKMVPNRCERAENLIIKYMGEQRFAGVFVDIDESPNKKMKPLSASEIRTLQHLVLLYNSRQDSRRLKQGMQILRYLELQHEIRKKKKNPGRARKENASANPLSKKEWLELYRSMIMAIRNYTFTSKKDKNEARDSFEFINLAIYASGLLDRMNAVGASPDSDIFDRILKIWRRVKSSESGEYAENILSRMQMQEVFNPSVQVTEDTYENVIHCWNEAAMLGHPEAAERASYLLRSMEVQSGVRELSREDDLSEIEEEIHDAVYNKNVRPRIHTYNNVLSVCAHSRQGPKKEHAVDEAIDIHKRLLNAGFEPSSVTYLSLFKCMNKNLHKDSPRRKSAGGDILKSAKASGIVFDPYVVKALKEVDSSLHREYLKELNKTLAKE